MIRKISIIFKAEVNEKYSINTITGRREDREYEVKKYSLVLTDFTKTDAVKRELVIDKKFLLHHERFKSII